VKKHPPDPLKKGGRRKIRGQHHANVKTFFNDTGTTVRRRQFRVKGRGGEGARMSLGKDGRKSRRNHIKKRRGQVGPRG